MGESRRPVRFRELLRALVDGGVEFIVVGGVAAVLEALIATKEAAGREKDRAVLGLLRQILAEQDDRG